MEFIYNENQVTLTNEDEQVFAEVTFLDVDEDTVNINHIFVDASLRGQGIAGKLLEATAKYLREQDKNVILSCSYAIKWFEKHPEYKGVCYNN